MPKKRRCDYLLVNQTTGEIVEPRKHKHRRTEEFYMTRQEDAIRLAKMKLTGMEHNVLLYLEGVMDYDNIARTTQKNIADELASTEATISTTINSLVEKNLLAKTEILGVKAFVVSKTVSERGRKKQDDR